MNQLSRAARVLVTTGAAGALAITGAGLGVAASKPGVKFVTPKSGAITTSTVTASVKLSNFTIDAAAVGKKAVAGKGHLHFSMDKGKFDRPKHSGANGTLAAKLGVAGKYSPSVAPTITYKGLPKGKHTLAVYLANNNHTNAGGVAQVSFTVK